MVEGLGAQQSQALAPPWVEGAEPVRVDVDEVATHVPYEGSFASPGNAEYQAVHRRWGGRRGRHFYGAEQLEEIVLVTWC